ncbi:hypothetical protein G9A89_023975 [Geosiphon pyriformis]|nr:hypothetical protein G9A89_023975 [Geosiphon pyriformis]
MQPEYTDYPAGTAGSGKGPVLVVIVDSVVNQINLLFFFFYKDSKNSKIIESFWEIHAKRENALMKSKLREEKVKTRMLVAETEAIAKVRELQAEQRLTVRSEMTEQMKLYAASATKITKLLLDQSIGTEGTEVKTPPSSPTIAMPRVGRTRHSKSGETDICSEESDSISEPDYESFTRAYNGMKNDKKWVLSTGTIVEDALYNFGIKCMHEHLSHSFVIDPDDENYLNEGIFTQHELEEIRGFQKKVLPPVPQDLLLYLDSFRTRTTADLRRLVFRQEAMDQNFDRHEDFDRDWIRNTVYNLLREYEADSLTKEHLELWLLIHVWSFIDKAFENISGIEAVRGESCCLASSARKNEKRTVAALITLKRKMLGRRGDLIIRKISTEYGCAEAGKLFQGEKGTKLLCEKGLKTPKMLKDIFNSLCAAVDRDEQKVRKLESIGFLHAGLKMSLLRLDSPAGYTCRISRSKLLEIPSQVAEFSSKVLPVILLAWRAKTIVAEMIRLVEEENELDEKDRLQHLLDSCETSSASSKRVKVDLPSALNTLQKRRKKILLTGQLGRPVPLKLKAREVSGSNEDESDGDDSV